MRAPGNCQCINSVRSCEKRTGSYVLPDTPPDQHFQLLFLHQENEEILLPPVRAVRLRYRHRRIVEAIPRYCSKETHQKAFRFQRGHGLQLRNKRGNRISKLASSVVLYVLGTSHEMTVYVRTQQILVSKK